MRQGERLRRGHILFVTGTFPLLTTTFIDRELAALDERGVSFTVVSMRRSGGHLSPEQSAMIDGVRYVLPVSFLELLAAVTMALFRHPMVLFGCLIRLTTAPHPSLRERARTAGHVVLGVYVWHMVRANPPDHVHAHFVDRAATVALVVAALLDIPYSATAHASDIYLNPILLPEKLSSARFTASCTAYNARHLSEVAPEARIELVYHGLDLDRYPKSSAPVDGVPRIISVAQLKERKGLKYLISACRGLVEAGVSFQCDIIGDGPLRDELDQQIRALELTEEVHLLGSLAHDDVIERLGASTIFALPCVVTEDGDRDGIPNVILEAMAVGRPVVSTPVSGIPEAVIDGVSGRLVTPGDASELADAVADLLESPDVMSDMGIAGRQRVEELFDFRRNAEKLEQLLLA